MSESTIQHNIDEFVLRLGQYQRASGKTPEQVLREKGARLGYVLRQEFRGMMPAKGAITAERLDALKEGEGLHLSKTAREWVLNKYQAVTSVATRQTFMAVRGGKKQTGKTVAFMATMVTDPKTGKRLNLQALAVQHELSVRESGRGFVGQSSRFSQTKLLSDSDKAWSRFGPTLGRAGFAMNVDGGVVTLKWGGYSELSDEAAKAMGRAKGQAAIGRSIKLITEDMKVYIDRKNGEDAKLLS